MIKNIKKVAAFILAMSLVSTALTGCSSSKASKEDSNFKVRYASYKGMTSIGYWLGTQKGIFKEAGLNIENVDVVDKPAAFISKSIDFGDMSTTQAILAIAKGAPFKIVASMFRTKGAFHLISNPNINKIEDLKGKKIGVDVIGGGMDVNLRIILKAHGIDASKDVTIIATGGDQPALASLEAKQVDATMIHEPFVQLSIKKGTGKLLARGWDYMPEFNTGVLVASDDLIKNHPETVKKLIAAYFKANTYAKEHRQELLDFGTTYLKVDRDILNSALDSENAIWANKPEVDVSTLQKTQEIQKEFGYQDKIYDTSKMVDFRFLPQK